MYQTDRSCSYMDDESMELYQQELLEVFQVHTCDDLILPMEQLYSTLYKNNKLQELLQKVEKKYEWANKEHCFYLLFSYDYFVYTHEYLKDLVLQRPPQNHDFLCSLFK